MHWRRWSALALCITCSRRWDVTVDNLQAHGRIILVELRDDNGHVATFAGACVAHSCSFSNPLVLEKLCASLKPQGNLLHVSRRCLAEGGLTASEHAGATQLPSAYA